MPGQLLGLVPPLLAFALGCLDLSPTGSQAVFQLLLVIAQAGKLHAHPLLTFTALGNTHAQFVAAHPLLFQIDPSLGHLALPGCQCGFALAAPRFKLDLTTLTSLNLLAQGLLLTLQSLLFVGQTLTLIEETAALAFQLAFLTLEGFTLLPQGTRFSLQAQDFSFKILLLLFYLLASLHEVGHDRFLPLDLFSQGADLPAPFQ